MSSRLTPAIPSSAPSPVPAHLAASPLSRCSSSSRSSPTPSRAGATSPSSSLSSSPADAGRRSSTSQPAISPSTTLPPSTATSARAVCAAVVSYLLPLSRRYGDLLVMSARTSPPNASQRVALAGRRWTPTASPAPPSTTASGAISRRPASLLSGVHVLRHTAAKLRRDVGESVESVSQFLDHSSLAVTTTYLRRLEGERDAAWHERRQRYRSHLAPHDSTSRRVRDTVIPKRSAVRWRLARLDLYAPSERSYIPLRSPVPLEVVLPGSHSPHRHLCPRLLRRTA